MVDNGATAGTGRHWPAWPTETRPAQPPLPVLRRRTEVYACPYKRIVVAQTDFGHFHKDYYVTESGRRVGLIVERDGAILLVRQYRLLLDAVSWEIPGGGVDEGETPSAAALRECFEETGWRCHEPRSLIKYLPGLDIDYNPTEIFFSTPLGAEPCTPPAHEGEILATAWVPRTQCLSMIAAGIICDSFSLIGLLRYLGMGKSGE